MRSFLPPWFRRSNTPRTAYARRTSDRQTTSSSRAGEWTQSDDLIESLHAQYWRTLADPHTPLSNACVPIADEASAHTGSAEHDLHGEWSTQNGNSDSQSIEGLLAREGKLEDAFGPLNLACIPDHETESKSDVLQLFAPAEYQADAARQRLPLPALTRREHHVLAVDSPLDDLGLLTLARAGSDVLITHDVAESATTESPHNDRT